MGDDPLALDLVAEVVADVGGAHLLDQGRPRRVDRRSGDGVGLGSAAWSSRTQIITHTGGGCQVGAGSCPWRRSSRAPGRMDAMTQPDPSPRPGRPAGPDRTRHGRSPGSAPGPRPEAAGPGRAGGPWVRGARGAARVTGRAGRLRRRQARRAADAEGAGDSGLARLIELHAFNAAGDAAVAISLAGTLFFQVPTGEARGQVALFLGLTMLPFAIVAPLIGPFLDRFSHGRRWAIGGDDGDARRSSAGCWPPPWSTSRRGCSRPRSACWSRPRRTASRARPPYPAWCRPT